MKNTSHTPARTSLTHPLGIDAIKVAQGQIGLTLAPGKRCSSIFGADWQRDLDLDIAALAVWRADLVVTLLTPDEMAMLHIPNLGAKIRSAGMEWINLPIEDTSTPSPAWWPRWPEVSRNLHARLERGERVVIHCRGGLERAAFVAALLLMERGSPIVEALARIAKARNGARPLPAQCATLIKALPPISNLAARNRACLMGGAIGDAMGAEIEFWSLAQIRAHFTEGRVHLIPHQGRMGAITDDTQMTMFTAEGILRAVVRAETRGICHAPGVVHHALLRWLKTQGEVPKFEIDTVGLVADPRLHHQRAPGLACLSGLRAAKRFGDTARNDSKGCGTIMRVAPVALCSATSPRDLALETSALTHGHLTGQEAAAVFVDILRAVARRVPLEQAVTESIAETHGETADALAHAFSAPRDGRAETVESLGGGWVAEEALAIAVYAALASDSFAAGLQIALCHSGDSDSTAAIAGNLLGLLYPAQVALHPAHDQIECADLIDRIARDLALAEDPATRLSDEFCERYPGW